uniref:DUF7030 domain-containing protein n=1 Tax=Lepeophtheirus salmonis TaxID=72036 RepID=A0A0K2TBD0_LEPSM
MSGSFSSKSLSLRTDNVGKRFLCVSGSHKIKINRYTEWPWRAGVIRCSSHLDASDNELQVGLPSYFIYIYIISYNPLLFDNY